MNRVAVRRLCACQGERGADEGAKACGAVEVDSRLYYANEVSSVQGPWSDNCTYGSTAR